MRKRCEKNKGWQGIRGAAQKASRREERDTPHTKDKREVTCTDVGWRTGLGDAFAAGLGMAMGLLMGQFLVQALTLMKAEVTVICQECTALNTLYTYRDSLSNIK